MEAIDTVPQNIAFDVEELLSGKGSKPSRKLIVIFFASIAYCTLQNLLTIQWEMP
jgi:hypothetical protein